MATHALFTPACADEDEMFIALLTGLIDTPALGAGGLVVYHWSDGIVYVDESGSPAAQQPFGPMDLGNPGAWIIFGMPGGNGPQIMIQKHGAGSWSLQRSAEPFTDGTADPTTPLTSVIAFAHLTTGALFPATPQGMFTSIEDANGYGATCFTVPPGGGNVKFIFMHEMLLSGTYSVRDNDPYLTGFYNHGTGFDPPGFRAPIDNFGIPIIKRYRHNKGGAANIRIMFERIVADHEAAGYPLIIPPPSATQQVGREPEDDTEVPRLIGVSRWGANSLNTGFCGHPRRLRWSTCGGHANGEWIFDGTDYWIYMSGIWVPWSSSEPAV